MTKADLHFTPEKSFFWESRGSGWMRRRDGVQRISTLGKKAFAAVLHPGSAVGEKMVQWLAASQPGWEKQGSSTEHRASPEQRGWELSSKRPAGKCSGS